MDQYSNSTSTSEPIDQAIEQNINYAVNLEHNNHMLDAERDTYRPKLLSSRTFCYI